jgi:hypothetical protein
VNQIVSNLGSSKNQLIEAVDMLLVDLLKESMDDDDADDETHPEIIYMDPIPIPPVQNDQ